MPGPGTAPRPGGWETLVYSATHRPPLPPALQEISLALIFVMRLTRPQDHSAAGRLMSMKASNDTIGNLPRDLPDRSLVPQPTAPPKHLSQRHTLKHQTHRVFCSTITYLFSDVTMIIGLSQCWEKKAEGMWMGVEQNFMCSGLCHFCISADVQK